MQELPPRLRARGFSPAEIGALLHGQVIRRHVDEAAFLWQQRRAALDAPHHRLEHLAKLDERLAAHLAGARLSEDLGWRLAQARLADGDAGAVFLAAWLAFVQQDPTHMRDTLAVGLGDAAYGQALVDALCWLEPTAVERPVQSLLASPHPSHRCVGLQVAAAQRLAVGAPLARLIEDPAPAVRAAALCAAGVLAQRDLAQQAFAHCGETDATCRFEAAWSSVLLGVVDAPAVLVDAARALPARAGAALQLAVRWVTPPVARDWIRSFAASPGPPRRLAVQMVGALGSPACAGWLIEQMDDPDLTRVAGEAFSAITGADLRYLDLDQDPPQEPPPHTLPEDEELPWPRPDAVAAWWRQRSTTVPVDVRLLCGRPLSRGTALAVLRQGYQRQRRAAAFELLRLGEASLFPVDWPARRQQAWLAGSPEEAPCA